MVSLRRIPVAQILDLIFGLEVESTTASREFREGGLCFKGVRSATVPYRVPSRDCSLGARLAVETPSSDDL